MNFLKSNFWEINRSSSLQNLGVILSILHVINYFYWKAQGHIFAATDAKPLLCWSIYPSCANNPLLWHATVFSLVFSLYFTTSVLAIITFIWRRYTGLSWFLLAFSNFFMLVFYFSDASLNLDIFSLFLVLNFTFLFIPGKSSIIRTVVVLFYFISGLRELTPETLSGVGLHEWIPLHLKLLEWVAAIGVAIKMILPTLLLSPFGQRLLLAVLGLLAYHGFYFYYMHDFKSLVLIGTVFFFVFDFFAKKRLEFEALYQSYAHPEPSKLWWIAVVCTYVLLQTPLLSGRSANAVLYITEPLPVTDCHLATFARYKTRLVQIESEMPHELQGAIRCHPTIAFNTAKELCSKVKDEPDFVGLNTTFVTRKLSQKLSQSIFSFENICDDTVVLNSIKQPI